MKNKIFRGIGMTREEQRQREEKMLYQMWKMRIFEKMTLEEIGVHYSVTRAEISRRFKRTSLYPDLLETVDDFKRLSIWQEETNERYLRNLQIYQKGIEPARYMITHRATYRQVTDHFGYCVEPVIKGIKKVSPTIAELLQQLALENTKIHCGSRLDEKRTMMEERMKRTVYFMDESYYSIVKTAQEFNYSNTMVNLDIRRALDSSDENLKEAALRVLKMVEQNTYPKKGRKK